MRTLSKTGVSKLMVSPPVVVISEASSVASLKFPLPSFDNAQSMFFLKTGKNDARKIPAFKRGGIQEDLSATLAVAIVRSFLNELLVHQTSFTCQRPVTATVKLSLPT
jgi:hypothetical protein